MEIFKKDIFTYGSLLATPEITGPPVIDMRFMKTPVLSSSETTEKNKSLPLAYRKREINQVPLSILKEETEALMKYRKKRFDPLTVRSELRYDKEGKCVNAFEVLKNPVILELAYETIKSKAGNMVKGSDNETLDKLPRTWFEETSKKLTEEQYDMRPSRRVYIPKANGKLRPLGISSPRDKIIQQSMRLVMEEVLEPKFLTCSHGFRPKRGCHTALKEIREWKGVPWLLEGDIKSFFDSIDHHKLEGLLKKHFTEPRLFHLYWKLVKAGYIEWNKGKKTFVESELGVPQGGIVSPLLSNLVLHDLDLFIAELIDRTEKENRGLKKNLVNPKYGRLSGRIALLKTKWEKFRRDGNVDPKGKEIRKELRKLLKERRRIPTIIPNPLYRKYCYARFADDWLVGIWGNKDQAQNLKTRVRDFLKEKNLELSLEKTLITNTRAGPAKFLGTLIKRRALNRGGSPCYVDEKGIKRRISSHQLILNAPLPNIVKRLTDKKFLKIKNNKYHPLSIPIFLALPITELIIRYRTILNGLLNYYSFADNRYQFNKIFYILRESLRKTISRKENLRKKEFDRRYGRNTTIKILKKNGKLVTLDFRCPPLIRQPMKFYGTKIYHDPLIVKNWRISTISALWQVCANCASDENIEMHHLKHIKTINTKLNAFDKNMARINRKQIPLCRSCHYRVHKGTYNGMSLKHFRHIRFEGEPKWVGTVIQE